ncbi:MAG: Re/Si-specific NAD(P)(+) transhydrogenase subunit alpha [Microbacteriaceae bacterium]|nr:Re/Si-specific NAD(P)(+) transhydrogenase subunit alpha [Microbacteriaceae bacterium]MCI1206828.1 Re/Si-specific NAD(P)(+) transhydrogenase subunit alpha [Microbacteriaceae bacterium]
MTNRIGVRRESRSGERMVAATPLTTKKLLSLGYDVCVESGAGEGASFSDEDYTAVGATIAGTDEIWGSDIVLGVNAPDEQELAKLRKDSVVISMMYPGSHPKLLEAFQKSGATAIALDAVPRISRAQSMDALSSMSNAGGYRAVIEAAEAYGAMFGGQVTAAGKTQPANVFVIGAGVAGLAAIGAAGSMGAQVRAFDVRAEVGEQIESMGATFVQADVPQQESASGYASDLSAEQEKLTMKMYAEETAKADIVITTALVRGKAVRTITAAMVSAMKPGSVIVDLAASGGGNCELTEPGKKVVTENGVIILGYTDLTSRMPRHTSQLYGTNIVNLLRLMTPGKDGQIVFDMDDVIVRGITVARESSILWPPPPISVSAAPQKTPAAPPQPTPEEIAAKDAAAAQRRTNRQTVMGAVAAVLVVLAITFSPASFLGFFTVFILAVFIGFYVISKVSHSLHTPLMSQTNAISGIILIGALLQMGSANPLVTVLAFAAAAIASINIFGGFVVTYRMLNMFRKD